MFPPPDFYFLCLQSVRVSCYKQTLCCLRQLMRRFQFMADGKDEKGKDPKKYSRRDFVIGGGTIIAGGALAAVAPPETAEAAANYPRSAKYLVYDSRGCMGCLACMLACSLTHNGATSLSLARIQVHRAVLKMYPLDIRQNVCRQCPTPLCVDNCPTGACHVSAENGNVRMIDEAKCVGCQTCVNSCPQLPHRIIWDQAKKKATKCDLCVNTPYYNKKGGPDGAQACVEACPGNALKVVDEMPEQADLRGGGDQNRGYDRNLQPAPKAGGFGFGPPGAKPGGAPGAKPGGPGGPGGGPGGAPGAKPDGAPGGAPDSKTPPPAAKAPGGN